MSSSTIQPPSRPLRFAIAADADRLVPWQVRVLDALDDIGVVVSSVVLVPAAPPRCAGGHVQALLAGLIDQRLGGSGAAIDDRLPGVPIVHDATELTSVDVLVDLTRAGVHLGPSRPESGVWRFRFGQSAPGLADAVASAALAGASTVEIVLERDGETLRAGVFRFDAYAPWSGAAAATDSFTAWPAWCATACSQGRAGDAPFGALPTPSPAPRGASGARSAARLTARAARDVVRRALWAEVWTVGLSRQPVSAVIAQQAVRSVDWLPERGQTGLQALWGHRSFAADPFLYRSGDRYTCLFEALDYQTNRGWIAEVDIPLAPGSAEARVVFRNEWHWSYPFVLDDDGQTWCIPETADANGVLLHRLTPAGFEQEADLLPGLAVLDPSIVRHDGRFWLFCTLRDGPLLNTALHLYVADRLTGPYRPHPCNPVKLDARSARPAGTIFEMAGQLFRPGQDCGDDYGAALVVHRIDELSERAYRETEVARLLPQPPYGAGLHTLSVCDEWLAIDAKRYAFSPRILSTRLATLASRRRVR